MPSRRLCWRQFACGAVRCGLQHPLAAAHDRKERHRPFFTPAAGGRIGATCSAIAADFYIKTTQVWLHEFGTGLKVNFSGSTTYAPIKLRNVVNKVTGERTRIEAAKRVKQWWFVADTGRVCVQVRYGTRVLELAKGKNSIEVANGDELLSVLETVKRCVEAGELDAQIDAASNAVRARIVK